MELVVYIAIMGIIVIVAGQAFSNSTKFRVRNQSMIEANEVARNIASLIKDDIAQMGAKSSKEDAPAAGGDDDLFSDVYSDVYMDPDNADSKKVDLSSFVLAANDLKFRRVRYDVDGTYMSVEEVRWFLDGKTLKRSCWTVSKRSGLTLAGDDPCKESSSDAATPVDIADNVESLSIIAGKPQVKEEDEQMFPPSGNEFMLVPRYGEQYYNLLNVNNSGNMATLSGFALNYNMAENKASDAFENPGQAERNQVYAFENTGAGFSMSSWKDMCALEQNHFTLYPDTTYEISFEMVAPQGDKMEMFIPGRDYLSIGFRDASGNRPSVTKDFLFYPPTQDSPARKRSMRFTLKEAVKDVCLAFTFVSFSPVTAEGTLTIEQLKLKRLATVSNDFDSAWNTENADNIVEKKNVKAFRLSLSVKSNGEEGVAEEVIATPSNGPKD